MGHLLTEKRLVCVYSSDLILRLVIMFGLLGKNKKQVLNNDDEIGLSFKKNKGLLRD